MKGAWSEYRFWSPLLGSEAARVSMADERGTEYFRIVPVDVDRDGKRVRWVELRGEALGALADAIDRGDEPGEVLEGGR